MFGRYALIIALLLQMIAKMCFRVTGIKFYILSGSQENIYLNIAIFTKEDNAETCMFSNVSTLKVNVL